VAREAADAEVATKAAFLAPPGAELATLDELGCDGLVVDADGDTRRSAGLHRFLIARQEAALA